MCIERGWLDTDRHGLMDNDLHGWLMALGTVGWAWHNWDFGILEGVCFSLLLNVSLFFTLIEVSTWFLDHESH